MRLDRARIVMLVALALGLLGISLYSSGLHPAHPVTTLVSGARGRLPSRRLIVFVKGAGADVRTYDPLLVRLLREPDLAGADLLLFDHRLGRLTIGRCYDFATRLRAEIDAQWIRHGGYEDVILAGHSTGSLLVRAAYLQAAGRDPRQPRTVAWSAHVSRIVLFAGIGRGVDAEEHGRWSWVLRVGRYVPFIRSSVMYDVLRGADFVTEVRIAWIRYFSELTNAVARDSLSRSPPMVVQLLGTEDAVVHRDDNIDLEQFPTAFHIDVPGAGHQTLHRLDLAPDPELAYALFREAFISSSLPHAARRTAETDSIQRVVLLLHGMRSSRNEWIRDIAPVLRARIPHAEVVESSYGWISLLGFALPSVRRREIRWLQDQYTEHLARHPTATFDVVAHSNGAYILGQALQKVPSMRFGRIALLGSVLPADYAWTQRHEWGQAESVLTDRAADDLVVAVLCNALRGVGMTDLGTSGWSGFDDSGGVEHEVAWYRGGHSAALASANLNDLAEFVASGAVRSSASKDDVGPSRSLVMLSQLSPWLARLSVAFLLGVLLRWAWRAPPGRRTRLGVVGAVVIVTAIVLDVI